MQVRDAVVTDLPAIVAIYNQSIPCQIVTADMEPVTLESRVAWFEAHSPQGYPLWVVEMGQEITGWLGFQSFYSGRAAYVITAELSIYVKPGYQRQGIGKLLLQEAIARSPSLEFKNLIGVIFADNQPSLRLFQQFGFKPWGYLPQVAKFDTQERDLVIVGRRL